MFNAISKLQQKFLLFGQLIIKSIWKYKGPRKVKIIWENKKKLKNGGFTLPKFKVYRKVTMTIVLGM